MEPYQRTEERRRRVREKITLSQGIQSSYARGRLGQQYGSCGPGEDIAKSIYTAVHRYRSVGKKIAVIEISYASRKKEKEETATSLLAL